MLVSIVPLYSVSLKVDCSDVHHGSLRGLVIMEVAFGARKPSHRVSIFPSGMSTHMSLYYYWVNGMNRLAKVGATCGEGLPHACCLHAEVAGHSQAPYKGQSPARAASRKGRPPVGRPATASPQGRPPVASPQGPAGSGQPARGCRPRTALPPVGEAAPAAGVAAPWQGAVGRKGQSSPA
ncbi:hypothetical protein BHM03_00003406 [Ensete ventricosum]|uniref:Uncharacterized protein n=1 Tax=Ensete ventricosum TaxID=4639 RepID=A0A445MA18_ENSVE|nr:hypothetical protein BHM03_00003406 [Ensete ventricosum]